jgi:amino acid transporter
MSSVEITDHDERRLAELGYVQRLQRGWSGFQNFAISFTIISILAGTFTTYGQAWNYGGPIAISIGWPVICGLILLVAFSMAEIASKYPTAGGLYYWASDLGGRTWGWFTGWFNFFGLIGIVASVIYGSATFLTTLLGMYDVKIGGIHFASTTHFLRNAFFVFVVLLIIHALINIYSSHLVALLNSVSVWWHVIGVAIIIALLVFVPDHHQSFSFVFGHRQNNSGGWLGGSSSGFFFWIFILTQGFLLTMYTQTGYDASAHISEETRGAALGAAKGVWRSVFWSGVFGWFVLLALTFAATDTKAIDAGGGSSIAIIQSALSTANAKLVILIATAGQFFCGMSCVTSASRMCFAFSRDRAVPGHRMWTRLNRHRVPYGSVILMCALALLITLPALKGAPGTTVPWAFFAVVLIATIGLYIAYVIPTYLRWRQGDSFVPGPWTLGRKYKWVNPAAIVWVIICVVCFSLPFTPAGWPWSSVKFQWEAVNYAPATLVLIGLIAIWWKVSANKWFTGPIREVELPDETGRVPEPAGGAAPAA